MSVSRLRDLLIRHEGMRLKPYKDSVGKLTIGVGRNLDDLGLTDLEARLLLSNDVDRVMKEAVANFGWFKSLNLTRQDVVLSMIFNMGLERFRGFKEMAEWLRVGNFERAADEMLNSLWAKQVGKRADELAQMMRTGSYPA